jgi:hypothetical protein
MTTPVSPEEALARLRALSEKATPGEWKTWTETSREAPFLGASFGPSEGGIGGTYLRTGNPFPDARFIVALVNWFRAIEGYRLVPAEDVDRLVNAAHRMAKWTSIQKGEDGGAFVHAMRQANTAEADTFRALGAFGISMTDKPPAAIKEHSDAV